MKNPYLPKGGLLTLALTMIAGPALAQDAGSLLREQERQRELQSPPDLPAEAGRQEVPSLMNVPESGDTVTVRQLRFTGETALLSDAEQARLSAAVTGQGLGIAGLEALAAEVTAILQREGHLLARAVLPPQDITEGVITLNIIEGALIDTEFQRSENVRVRESLLSAIGEAHIQDATAQSLEEALLRMNDLPGVSARAILRPGETPNTSRLLVAVDEAPRLSGALWANSYGVASTGEEQFMATASLSDLSGYGDLGTVYLSGAEGQTFLALDGSLPLGASAFTLGVNYGYLDYENVDAVGAALGLAGKAHFIGLDSDYSLIRSRGVNLRLSAGFDWKALEDDSAVGLLQDKRVTALTFGIAGDRLDAFGGGGLSAASLSLTLGDLDLSRLPPALAADQAGLDTDGSYRRLNLNLSRLQSLPGDFSLYARAYGQWAGDNLDSSEDFALGGPYGLRGWPVGEARGDSGWLGTLELRYDAPLPPPGGQLQVAAFLDAGQIRRNQDSKGIPATNACGCDSYGLESVGLSARWLWQRLSVSAVYARGIGDNPGRSALTHVNADGGTGKNQLWLQAGMRF